MITIKHAKARIRSQNNGKYGNGNTAAATAKDQQLKQLAFFGAILVVIAAIISLYIAWEDVKGANIEVLF